jgi:hypothetical protein
MQAGVFYLYLLIAVALICYTGMGVLLIGNFNTIHLQNYNVFLFSFDVVTIPFLFMLSGSIVLAILSHVIKRISVFKIILIYIFILLTITDSTFSYFNAHREMFGNTWFPIEVVRAFLFPKWWLVIVCSLIATAFVLRRMKNRIKS